jgi:hypothetical protein
VRVSYQPDTLDLEITDDGRGAPASADGHGGQGLIGMWERAAAQVPQGRRHDLRLLYLPARQPGRHRTGWMPSLFRLASCRSRSITRQKRRR